MKFQLLILVVSMSFVSHVDAADSNPCGSQIPKTAKSIDECESASKPYWDREDCESTASMRDVLGGERVCFKNVMDHQLDERLLKLKNSNQSQFSKEMALQKAFNQGIKEYCDQFYSCSGGTIDFLNGAGCYNKFYKYRSRQAVFINQGALDLPDAKPSPYWNSSFKAYAKAVCAMPAEVWKAKKSPVNCESRVLADMESGQEGTKPAKDECQEAE